MVLISICIVALICAALLLYFYRRKHIPITHKEYYEDKSVRRTYVTLNGVMHGQETTYYPNHQVMSEFMWVNGEKMGPFVEYYDNGKIACKGEFQDKEKVADCFVYYPTGETNKEQLKNNDIPDGPFTVFFKSGHPYIQGNYKQGVLEGEYTVYALNGDVKFKKHY